MKKMVSIVLVMVLLASAAPLAIMPAGAISEVYEEKIPFAGEDNELTKDELVNAILPYMLEEGEYSLDDVGDAAYIYAYWNINGVGKPKTIVDALDRTVTFYRPLERVVAGLPDSVRLIVALGKCDKLVGVSSYGKTCLCKKESVCAAKVCGGRLFELPEVGMYGVTNQELAVSLEPDVLFDASFYAPDSDLVQEKTGIPAVCVNWYTPVAGKDMIETLYRTTSLVGELLGAETEAEELNSFIEETVDKVGSVTSEIPEEEKPKVYVAGRGLGRGGVGRTHPQYTPLDIAGGINVAKDVPGASTSTEVTVTLEQIIKWNPDIIIIASSSATDPLEALLTNYPQLETVNAVKNESVYYFIYPYCLGMPHDRNLINMMYLAKLFYPDKFQDLDVEEEGNGIMERFLGADGLFSEYADGWWMREWLDEQQKS